MTCGAVIAPMPKSSRVLCESHEVLGNAVNHIVPLHQPKKNRFDIIPLEDIVLLEDIIDVCLNIKFSDSEVGYAAHFPNHFEKDWTLTCIHAFSFANFRPKVVTSLPKW